MSDYGQLRSNYDRITIERREEDGRVRDVNKLTRENSCCYCPR